MALNEYFTNYHFEKYGIIILLLPLEKQPHCNTKPKTSILKRPSNELIHYLLQQQTSQYASSLDGELLICNFFTSTHGSCIAVFPELRKLRKRNINKAAILTFADTEIIRSSFYISNNGKLKPVALQLMKDKVIINRFSSTIPQAIWIKPDIKKKLIIKGCYLDPSTICELADFPKTLQQ